MNRIRYVLIGLVVATTLFAGCLSGPLPENMPKTSTSETPEPLPLESLSYISFDAITYSVDSDFKDLVPVFDDLVFLPNINTVDVVSNDLEVQSHPRRLQILASIADKTSGVYVQPRRDSNLIIYFTVYRLNDTETTLDLLDAYKEAWNKRLLNISGAEIWIWDGYLDEIAGVAQQQAKNTIVYWDQQNKGSFIYNNVLPTYPALTKTETALYSVHGETAYENYFIMIDVKAELEDIQNQTDQIFTEAASQIFNVPATLSQPKTTDELVDDAANETTDIKEELRLLLENYLAGNISKEEYDRSFEEYTG